MTAYIITILLAYSLRRNDDTGILERKVRLRVAGSRNQSNILEYEKKYECRF